MKVTAFLACLLLLQPIFAQNFSDLDAVLGQKQKLLGKDFVVMIWKKDDTLVYKKEIGQFNSKTQAPIAGSGQWLTAALVMMFVEEGKISLDDKITRWLPEYEKYGKNYITIRHCLTHYTGIRSEAVGLKKLFDYSKKYTSLEEEVNDFAAKDIQTNPGEEFRYSNIGLNIAARILEIVSKKKFDILARQRLLVPLGMRKTSFTNLEGGAINPSGGAVSNADDYMQFLKMILNKGMFQGRRILSEESITELLKVNTIPEHIKYAPKQATGFSYASGAWAVEENNGAATVITSPSLFGMWPVVDYCRGYAYLLFVKTPFEEEKSDAQMEVKRAVDEQFTSTCK